MKKIILCLLFLTVSVAFSQTEIPQAKDWNWVKHPGNPIMVSSTSFDAGKLYYLSVIEMDGKYHMWYRCDGLIQMSSFGHATSDDGITWTKHPSAILTPGGDGACPHETYIAA